MRSNDDRHDFDENTIYKMAKRYGNFDKHVIPESWANTF